MNYRSGDIDDEVERGEDDESMHMPSLLKGGT
jgi:hypothetical protein